MIEVNICDYVHNLFSFFKHRRILFLNSNHSLNNFYWGGSEEESKINWINWDKVYRPLDEGVCVLKT